MSGRLTVWRDFGDLAAAALLAVGAVVWLIVVPLMFLQGALLAGWGFGPGSPAAASATFTWASWLGVGIPLVGVVVSATTRRRGWTWFYGICVGVVAVVAAVRWAQTHHAPPPPPEPTHCVERSGGESDCP